MPQERVLCSFPVWSGSWSFSFRVKSRPVLSGSWDPVGPILLHVGKLFCYFIHPFGIERDMSPDVCDRRERVLVCPDRIDGFLASGGNAVVVAIAFVRAVGNVVCPFQLRKINILAWNILNGRMRRFAQRQGIA